MAGDDRERLVTYFTERGSAAYFLSRWGTSRAESVKIKMVTIHTIFLTRLIRRIRASRCGEGAIDQSESRSFDGAACVRHLRLLAPSSTTTLADEGEVDGRENTGGCSRKTVLGEINRNAGMRDQHAMGPIASRIERGRIEGSNMFPTEKSQLNQYEDRTLHRELGNRSSAALPPVSCHPVTGATVSGKDFVSRLLAETVAAADPEYRISRER